MLKRNLKEEYKLRYNIMQYKKYYKLYSYMCYEKNNFDIITDVVEQLRVNQCVDNEFLN